MKFNVSFEIMEVVDMEGTLVLENQVTTDEIDWDIIIDEFDNCVDYDMDKNAFVFEADSEDEIKNLFSKEYYVIEVVRDYARPSDFFNYSMFEDEMTEEEFDSVCDEIGRGSVVISWTIIPETVKIEKI